MAMSLVDDLKWTPTKQKSDEYLYELKCRNCGGALDPKTLKCPYCGSQYERKNEHMGDMVRPVYIQTCPAQLTPLQYQMRVSDEAMRYYPQEEMARICMEEITHELAKALVPYVKIETQRDLCNMQQIIRGTVRVVEPDFRF